MTPVSDVTVAEEAFVSLLRQESDCSLNEFPIVAAQVYYGIGGSLEVEVIGSGRKTLSPLRKIKPAFPRHRSCLLDTIQQTR